MKQIGQERKKDAKQSPSNKMCSLNRFTLFNWFFLSPISLSFAWKRSKINDICRRIFFLFILICLAVCVSKGSVFFVVYSCAWSYANWTFENKYLETLLPTPPRYLIITCMRNVYNITGSMTRTRTLTNDDADKIQITQNNNNNNHNNKNRTRATKDKKCMNEFL